jgi:hypothetical protein
VRREKGCCANSSATKPSMLAIAVTACTIGSSCLLERSRARAKLAKAGWSLFFGVYRSCNAWGIAARPERSSATNIFLGRDQ